MADTDKPRVSVSVRELVEFVLRTGDLGGSDHFVGPARALEGTRGHQRVQRSRPAGYQTEVAFTHHVETAELTLVIRGRIDGLLPDGDTVLLEEIKTVQGAWDGQADPLHWAQGKIYAHIHASRHGLKTVDVQLTYLELDSNRLTELRETFTAAALEQFFNDTVAVYLEWARQWLAWRAQRDASIAALAFPFPQYRAGQRELSVAVYRALARGAKLFAEAPTGIGKTVAVLFPALKALGEGKFEKLFYLTAKTSGRAIAEKALADLRAGGLRCRSVTLTAKEKICFNNGQPCDMAACPFAIGYFDRVKVALREALQREALTRAAIEEVARRHQVCPFELSLDASLWVDAVIGDYNYVFDPRVYLKRFFAEDGGAYAFLVDEAHNLVERARDMFSAELRQANVAETRRALQGSLPACAKALARVNTTLTSLAKGLDADDEAANSGDHLEFDYGRGEAAVRASETSLVMEQLPESLPPVLRQFLKEAEVWLARNEPAPFRESLMNLYFGVNGFLRTAELYDERYRTLIDTSDGLRVRLFCLDPSFLIARALERGQAAVFFSATLTPMEYFRASLG
ncbi:MAG: ATP-dependent DNA helicase, partial [Verrucomicrobiota bacterium]